MSTPGSPSLAPIALKRDEGDALWAFGGLAVIKTSREANDGRVFVVEMLAPGELAHHCTCTIARTSGST